MMTFSFTINKFLLKFLNHVSWKEVGMAIAMSFKNPKFLIPR